MSCLMYGGEPLTVLCGWNSSVWLLIW